MSVEVEAAGVDDAGDVVSMDEDSSLDDPLPLSLSLLNLPVEILFHICSFLDPPTLIHGLGLACKRLRYILEDDSMWKVRINRVFRNVRFPVLPPDENDRLFWKSSCVDIEKQLYQWRNECLVDYFTLPDIHSGSSVDALLLVNKGNTLVSGGRDRSLVCTNLADYGSEGSPWLTRINAHGGWIWDITSMNDTIYTCSWDKYVKSWNLGNGGIELVGEFEMNVSLALLCVSACQSLNMIATGSFSKTVILFDPRCGRTPIATYDPHRRAVMKIAMNDNYILSASEDKTVAVWDQRSRKVTKTIELCKDSYPIILKMDKGAAVHVGDSIGNIHILDGKKDFELVKSFPTGHVKGITGLHCTPGCWITGSLDRTIRWLSPTDPPITINVTLNPHGEIAGMDYSDGVLATSSQYIHIWRPRTRTTPADIAD